MASEILNGISSYVPGSAGTGPSVNVSSGMQSSPGAAAIGSVLLNLLTWFGSNIWSDQRAQTANQQNLAQWQRETQYNSPLSQMARLRAAGINPALAYASGDLVNEAAASPQLQYEPVTSPVTIDPLTAAQVANLDSQTRLNDSQVPLNQERANEVKQSARKLELEGNFASATLAARIGDMLATSNLSAAKAVEELKYVSSNVKAEADRIQSIADKAKNESLISQEQYEQAKELTRKLRAEADIAVFDKDKAQFWHEVYSRAIQVVQTTEQVVSFLKLLYGKGSSSVKEDIDYFFPDKP